jgi:hypothetical protein
MLLHADPHMVYVSVIDPDPVRLLRPMGSRSGFRHFGIKNDSFRPFYTLNVSAPSVSQSNAGGLLWPLVYLAYFRNGSRAESKMI